MGFWGFGGCKSTRRTASEGASPDACITAVLGAPAGKIAVATGNYCIGSAVGVYESVIEESFR